LPGGVAVTEPEARRVVRSPGLGGLPVHGGARMGKNPPQ